VAINVAGCNVDEQNVTFGYKAYAQGQRPKTMTLAPEFVRPLFALPERFVKIRHYACWAITIAATARARKFGRARAPREPGTNVDAVRLNH
jgi:hypothetical protein